MTTPTPAPKQPSGAEQRKSTRVKFRVADNLEVQYKFLSHLPEYQSDEIFKGTVVNLSKGGALFEGTVPGLDWLPKLGEGQILIGVNVMTPGSKPIKALASLRWTKPAVATGAFEIGVQFEQIEPEHRQSLERFLIGHQIKTRRVKRDSAE
jgi:c-di-GMP-binding flagellar brake protein YcgR